MNPTESKELTFRETISTKSMLRETLKEPISTRIKESKQTFELARTLSSAQQWSY